MNRLFEVYVSSLKLHGLRLPMELMPKPGRFVGSGIIYASGHTWRLATGLYRGLSPLCARFGHGIMLGFSRKVVMRNYRFNLNTV
jgi:hypothetical protein